MAQKYNWKEFGMGLSITIGMFLVVYVGNWLYDLLYDFMKSYDLGNYYDTAWYFLAAVFFIVSINSKYIWEKSKERTYGVFFPFTLILILALFNWLI